MTDIFQIKHDDITRNKTKALIVLSCLVELFFSMLSQFAPAPFNYLSFTAMTGLLLYLTVKQVLAEAVKNSVISCMNKQFDHTLEDMLTKQRSNLIACFEKKKGNQFERQFKTAKPKPQPDEEPVRYGRTAIVRDDSFKKGMSGQAFTEGRRTFGRRVARN